MRKFLFLSLPVALSLLFASCSKTEVLEDQYEFTEVKIVASPWIAADTLIWTDTSFSANAYKGATVYVPELTESMLATGAVLIYAKTATADSEQALPYKIFDDTGSDHDLYNVKTTPLNLILLHTKITGGAAVKPTIDNNIQFRYILIQDQPTPNTRLAAGKAAGFTIAELKKMKYKDLVRTFRIKG